MASKRTPRSAARPAARASSAKPDALETYRQKRDFTKTSEPAGGHAGSDAPTRGVLHFVIQKHAASQLHFDLRLELDGVMKSWAVPKGPSLDPTVKRLAMQVEDHPIEYNTFEGTIPEGEYGGGTVMLWDHGTYGPDPANRTPSNEDESDEALLRAAYERGDFKFVLLGERLRGSWVLVRTRFGASKKPQAPNRQQWLLIKHRDEFAEPGGDIVATDVTSVTTGRTMDEIAAAGETGGDTTSHATGAKTKGAAAKDTQAKDAKPKDKNSRSAKKPKRGKQVSARAAAPKKRAAPRGAAVPGTAQRGPARRATSAPKAKKAVAGPGAAKTRAADGTARHRAAKAKDPVAADGQDELSGLPFPLTHLDKVMFPKDGYTKGDLAKYYARVAAQILPVVRDRPLALKRYPDGIDGAHFFQQKAPAEGGRPASVRVDRVPVVAEGGTNERIVGGTLATLLYTVQLGCIEVDPWHARMQSLETPDYAMIDLDPAPNLPFERIVEVATWVHDALGEIGLEGMAKTSGSRGIHIYMPLSPRIPSATALALAQRVANRVIEAHPGATTIERELDRRPPRSVYLDCLQNNRGKTMAAAYSVRPVDGAQVSMPLAWAELKAALDPRQFTIGTAPSRIEKVGDLWAEGMSHRNSAAAVRDAVGGS